MGHDQRFKEFLQLFLQDFLKLFYPEVEERLDFETLELIDKELFTDFPEGNPREADVVAKLRNREGSPEIVLIHVEIQSRSERDFEVRMFGYYAMLWLRYQLPIFPIVVYLRGGKRGLTTEEYRTALFGREILRFRYMAIEMAPLDAEVYREGGGPVGAALSALMDHPKAADPVELRFSMVKQVAESELAALPKFLLVHIIAVYFELTAEEMQRYWRLVSRKEYRKVQEVELTWADKLIEQGRQEGAEKGREEGHEEGRRVGLIEGKRGTLLRLLTAKFGPLPEATSSRVQALESLDELDSYFERALKATSLEEVALES